MLKIRLARIGRKNDPTFRVVVTEHTRGPKSGNHLEILGNYNPKMDNAVIDGERVKHWISNGAQVSDTVHNILIKEGIIKGKKINVLPKKSPIVVEKEESSDEVPSKDSATDGETSSEETATESVEEKPEESKEDVKEEVPVEEEVKEGSKTEEAPVEEVKEEEKK